MIILKMCKSFLWSRDFVTQNKKGLGFVKPQIINFVTENTTLKPGALKNPELLEAAQGENQEIVSTFAQGKIRYQGRLFFLNSSKLQKRLKEDFVVNPLFCSLVSCYFYCIEIRCQPKTIRFAIT